MSEIEIRDNLLPRFFQIKGQWARRQYLEDAMVDLAERNDLYLTELMNYDEEIYTALGEIIMGVATDDGSHGQPAGKQNTNMVTRAELDSYRVKIKSAVVEGPNGLTGEREHKVLWDGKQTIQYRHGSKPSVTNEPGRTRRRTSRIQQQFEPNIIDLKTTEASVTLQQAWLILSQAGVGAKYIVSDRDKYEWKYLEVRPEPSAEEAEEKPAPRRGRRRPAALAGASA